MISETAGIKTIGINRPTKRNCLDSATIVELRRALKEFDEDDNFNVAVLYGEGGTFCSGFDLNEVTEKGYDSLLEASVSILNIFPYRFTLSYCYHKIYFSEWYV